MAKPTRQLTVKWDLIQHQRQRSLQKGVSACCWARQSVECIVGVDMSDGQGNVICWSF